MLSAPSIELVTGAAQLTTHVSPTQEVPGPHGPGGNGTLVPLVVPQPVMPPELPLEAEPVVASSCATDRQQDARTRRMSGRGWRTRGLSEQAWCQVKGLKLHAWAAPSEALLDGSRHSDLQSTALERSDAVGAARSTRGADELFFVAPEGALVSHVRWLCRDVARFVAHERGFVRHE